MDLTAHTREIRGKKVKTLRREGITPVHVFGRGIEPEALQCDTIELQKVLAQSGSTGIVGLRVDKSRKKRNVMIREVQKEPRSGQLLHIDFYQIRMEEKLKVDVPIILTGEAPALKMKEYFLSHELDTLSVECLPDNIPSHIEVDVSILEEADQSIHVQDIVLGEEITVFNNPDQLIAKINIRHIEAEIEAEEVEAAEEGEAETADEETSEDTSSEE
ncbi:MAG: 50S ribosomal protein L25 [Dehalococcoidales bacterium]|nr:50S ribosomal protein L25 [Dehalococcoidales bacterium]